MKNLSKEEVYQEVKKVLVETFELNSEDISPEATLYQDLDLDSIDAVDLVVTLQEKTDKKINPESFKQIRTVQDITDSVFELLQD